MTLPRGFGLTDGGYYFAISDKMDLKLRGDIFTKGSWALNAETNYNVRYKFSGLFQASYQVTKTGDKGLDDYAVAKDFRGCLRSIARCPKPALVKFLFRPV